jgi:hypothetical protein
MEDKYYKFQDARIVCLNVFDFITGDRTNDEIFEALMQLYDSAEKNGMRVILAEQIEVNNKALKYLSGETR